MTQTQLDMIQDLCNLEEGLNDWELEFIESLSHKPKDYLLSDKQEDKLIQTWEQHCG